jgi:uracil-DNA glycosylase
MSLTSDQVRRVVLQRLESLQLAGVQQLPRGSAIKSHAPVIEELLPRKESIVPQVVRPSAKPTAPSGFEATKLAPPEISNAATLEILAQEVAACTRCTELAGTRTQTVFGVGNPSARLVFLGEAPGADEDRLGEPFVGRAGQLLTKIIEACKMRREDVYIMNVLKCRPPGNRNPLPEESHNCSGFRRRQLELIDPEFVCCLGAIAAQAFLNTTASIGKLRGSVHLHEGRKVVCTYHPAYLLRNPSAKRDTWEDMKLLMREMGVEL